MKRLFCVLLTAAMLSGSCLVAHAKGNYIITTPQQLSSMSDPYGTYTLGADIDMAGLSYTQKSNMYQFFGVFDGAGHTIFNLAQNYNRYGSSTGLLGSVQKGAVVKNVTLSNCSINATQTQSLSFLASSNSGTIDNCHIKGGVINATGATRAEIKQAYDYNASVTGMRTMENTIYIPDSLSISGLANGGERGTITNSSVQMTVNVPFAPMGGVDISGMSSAFMSNNVSSCDITVSQFEGQVAASMYGFVAQAENCSALGKITVGTVSPNALSAGVAIGGFVTFFSGGEVRADNTDPLLNRRISNSSSNVNITCRYPDAEVGGFVASFNGPYTGAPGKNLISSCTAAGTVNVVQAGGKGIYNVGEFVGSFSTQSMSDCTSTVSLTVDGSSVDAFAGRMANPILFSNCG